MIFFGEQSLRRAIAEFIHHYHEERNHQGLENALIESDEHVGSLDGNVFGNDAFRLVRILDTTGSDRMRRRVASTSTMTLAGEEK